MKIFDQITNTKDRLRNKIYFYYIAWIPLRYKIYPYGVASSVIHATEKYIAREMNHFPVRFVDKIF